MSDEHSFALPPATAEYRELASEAIVRSTAPKTLAGPEDEGSAAGSEPLLSQAQKKPPMGPSAALS
jgi:hypothetical protein